MIPGKMGYALGIAASIGRAVPINQEVVGGAHPTAGYRETSP